MGALTVVSKFSIDATLIFFLPVLISTLAADDFLGDAAKIYFDYSYALTFLSPVDGFTIWMSSFECSSSFFSIGLYV